MSTVNKVPEPSSHRASTARLLLRERNLTSWNGYVMFIIALGLIGGAVYLFVQLSQQMEEPRMSTVAVRAFMIVVGVFILKGFYMLQPNEAILLTLFG